MRGKQSKIYTLVKNCVDLVKDYKPTETLKLQCQTHKIESSLKSLSFQEFKFNKNYPPKGIGIRNIFMYNSLRLTIYYLNEGQVMKIHDHPRMSVVSYMLKGKMYAKQYTNIESNRYQRYCEILEQKDIRFIDGIREKNHNLHQFLAVKSTFFLDIIFPDYNQQRQCKYYVEQSICSKGKDEVILRQLQNINIDFFQI